MSNLESPRPVALSRARRLRLLYAGVVLVAGLTLGELAARLRGIKPYSPHRQPVQVEPGNRLTLPHPALGYTHVPGKFTVTLPAPEPTLGPWTFTMTHDTNTLRVTRPAQSPAPARRELWVSGCSLTHGWSLNDDETYPWLLQATLPDYTVVNCGVSGYGTLQSQIQLEEMLKLRAKPAVVILAYASFHDVRNTLVRLRRKSILTQGHLATLAQPYLRRNRAGVFERKHEVLTFAEWPLMRYSALIHALEIQYDRFEATREHSRDASREIVRQLAGLCAKNQIQFGVAGITADSQPILEFCRELGIPAVDISVNLEEAGNTNRPYDSHPSARANRVFAERLTTFIRVHFSHSAR